MEETGMKKGEDENTNGMKGEEKGRRENSYRGQIVTKTRQMIGKTRVKEDEVEAEAQELDG